MNTTNQMNQTRWDEPAPKKGGCLSCLGNMIILIIVFVVGFIAAIFSSILTEEESDSTPKTEKVAKPKKEASAQTTTQSTTPKKKAPAKPAEPKSLKSSVKALEVAPASIPTSTQSSSSTTTDSQHLTFKNVPIDGTLNAFIKNMQKASFTYEGKTSTGVARLVGDFAGYKACEVNVATQDTYDIVSKITVKFESHREWMPLEEQYNSLKTMLTGKYGQPAKVVQRFPETPRDNWWKFNYLREGEATWYTLYKTSKGTIKLSLGKGYYSTQAAVFLEYADRINSNLAHSAAVDDL